MRREVHDEQRCRRSAHQASERVEWWTTPGRVTGGPGAGGPRRCGALAGLQCQRHWRAEHEEHRSHHGEQDVLHDVQRE